MSRLATSQHWHSSQLQIKIYFVNAAKENQYNTSSCYKFDSFQETPSITISGLLHPYSISKSWFNRLGASRFRVISCQLNDLCIVFNLPASLPVNFTNHSVPLSVCLCVCMRHSLGWFSQYVAMSMCVSVCLWVVLCHHSDNNEMESRSQNANYST